MSEKHEEKGKDSQAEEVEESAPEVEPEGDGPKDPGRRNFLITMGGVGAIWAGASLYPVYKYLAPREQEDPFKDGKVVVEKVTSAEVASPGMGKNGGYAGRGLIIYRDKNNGLRAFDSKCTHAGCNVSYETERLFCHCHGGVYDLDGVNIDGPPPAPLTELKAFEEDGVLYVSKKEG